MARPKGSTNRTITRLLIANRGEIARRVQRSAHEMGIATVAVHADGDADAPFVKEADQAIALGGRSSAETYLDVSKILAAAARTGADAIHPGYGFLAERADFARAVIEAGLIWVGPTPEAIAAMGDKLSAKRAMTEAGVPTLPAAELGPDDDPAKLAKEIGYPLLIKASAGGGGKGMRVVESEDELTSAVEGARREAAAAFGDDTVFLERWLAASRHVEIQLLGDRHGHLVHLFERECSIQRRHQKIIEEAPSPAVDEALRVRMGAAAVAAGQAIGYSSAGTVEFLLEEGPESDGERRFWFLEMNTRLQVEHPVTEEITGLDLVREQLRIAEGEPLSFTQEKLSIDGHAIEARLYAEDPSRGFLPATGRLLAWEPCVSPQARFDAGVEAGCEIGIEFDPMIAKVVVHAPTRREAAARLARVLETTRVQGVVTNRDFLVATLRTPEFLAGDTTTDFVERVAPPPRRIPTRSQMAEAGLLAAMAAQHDRRKAVRVLRTLPSGWRNTILPPEEVVFRVEGENLQVSYRIRRDGSFRAAVAGPTEVDFVEGRAEGAEVTEHVVEVVSREGESIALVIDGRRIAGEVGVDGERVLVHGPDGDFELIEQSRFPVSGAEGVAGGLVAPMPAKVISTHVAVGETVEKGQLLIVLEAMKMEQRIVAPAAGTVSELRVGEGDQVANGELLVVLAEAEGD